MAPEEQILDQGDTDAGGETDAAETILGEPDADVEAGEGEGDGDGTDQADDAGDDAADKAQEVPETYEFKVEGMELDATAVEKFTPVFKEIGLSQANAQKLVDIYAATQKEQQESVQKFYAEMKAESAKIPAAELGLAKKAMKVIPGDPDAKAIMADPYMGNHPALLRYLSKLGAKFSEGRFHEGVEGQGAESMDAKLNKMYPSMAR